MSIVSELNELDDWKLLAVEEIAKVKGGKRLPAGEEFANEITPYPYLRVTNMVNGTIKDEGVVYVKPEIQKYISNYTISSSDLYVTIAGTLGQFGRIPEKYNGAQLTENAAKLTKIDLVKYDLNYLNYSLRGDFIQSQINREIGVGAGVPKLALHRIEKLKVPLPRTIIKQQKIAKILTTIDKLIEKTQALIDKHTAIKQGMMTDLFTRGIDPTTGQLRPPVEQASHLYKETELGWIPKDWDYTVLGKYIEKYLYGPRFDAAQYSLDGNVKTIRGTDFTKDGKILYDQVPIAEIPITKIRHHILKDGDLVVITTADCGLTAVFEEQDYDYIPSAYAVKLKLKEDVLPYYIKAYMQTYFAEQQVNKYVRQGTLGNLPGSDILKFLIAVPCKSEQSATVRKLATVDNLVDKEKVYLKKLITKKNGLMQDLLTGEVKVTYDNIKDLD